MSTEQNKALYRRLTDEAWNAGKLEVLDQILSPDFLDHEEYPGKVPGRDGTKQLIAMTRTAFPDIHTTVDDLIAEGDKVVAISTARGTHRGPYLGMPPTGKPIKLAIIDVFRCANGKIVEHWGLTDALGMMQQLGAVPMPGGGGRPPQ